MADTKKSPKDTNEVEALDAEQEGVVEKLKVRDQEFDLAPEISAMTMLRLSASADPKTPVPKQMTAILAFLQNVVADEDSDEFLAFLENARPVIDFEELNEILTEATEIIGNRPTQP